MYYCTSCGKERPESVKFCESCGEAVPDGIKTGYMASDLSQSAPRRAPHPYQHLGGFLAFIAYSQLVVVGLFVVALAVSLATMASVAPLISLAGAAGLFLSGMLWLIYFQLVLYYGIVFFICLKFFWMIRRRQAGFFRFFELVVMVLICLQLISLILGANVGNVVVSMAVIISIFLTFTVYYRTSVRVRTYFGSDRYLRESLFSSRVQSPIPAVDDEAWY